MSTNPKVDDFLNNVKQWQKELMQLREIILDCGLTEDFKWKVPCYTSDGKNIVLIHGFKEYCALLFMKGALHSDPNGILIQQTENVQSGRQIRFNRLKDILKKEQILKSYIFEAIEIEKSGLKINYTKNSELDIPEELVNAFVKNEKLKTAFETLTPGRQKAYKMFFAEAKQSKTREERIKKYSARIFNGKGLNDCVCGLSKRMPNCDGSHKTLIAKKS